MRATLPSGRGIHLIAPPAFIGTRLEAFNGRGRGDFLSSHDIEDIITIVGCSSRASSETGYASMAPIYYERFWDIKYPMLDELE